MDRLTQVYAQRQMPPADPIEDLLASLTGGDLEVRPTKLSPEMDKQRKLGLAGMAFGGNRAIGKVGTTLYGDVQNQAEAAQKADVGGRLKLAQLVAQRAKAEEDREFRREMFGEQAGLRREIAGMSAANSADRAADRAAAREDSAANKNAIMEDRMRQQFVSLIAPQRTAMDAATGIRSVVQGAQSQGRQLNAQEQQMLIVGVNKLLDPGSVVREGEFARTQQGQAYAQQLLNYANQFATGRKLGPEAVNEIVAIVEQLDKAARDQARNHARLVGEKAKQRGLDPVYTTADLYQEQAEQAAAGAAPAAAATPPNVKIISVR